MFYRDVFKMGILDLVALVPLCSFLLASQVLGLSMAVQSVLVYLFATHSVVVQDIFPSSGHLGARMLLSQAG